ncbi:hypothetical protein AK830_g5251 [Neonectria ditissima]|uniref:Telomeric single stranded DNA binding POT1/Cdc13 domain-containing protein n=1 Tax=Neonectria ditissima TaxID=78410 RepID=A0A0P7ATY7_9HYPO|nr:hypothetical protein AK830_g5251 [Neonectria ditissima]
MPDNEPLHDAIRTAEPTPIALLNPDIPDQKTRIVDGAITITWPFSIVTKSIAFIVAERDFRLRRDKGQVRIRFHGAAAKAVTDAAVGGGDEIRLSLDGAQWEKNETNTQLAGSTLEWQLEFSNRLSLIVKTTDSQEEKTIQIDADVTNGTTDGSDPLRESHDEPPSTSDLEIPLPGSPGTSLSTKRPASPSFEPQEFASPAFIKRARVSYGSLFEGGLDIFAEDVGRKSKPKKKSRFSLPANAWRYSSRSPSPEVENEQEESNEPNGTDDRVEDSRPNQEVTDVHMDTPPRPSMVDEGCQTMDVDFTPMHSVQVLAESRSAFAFPYSTPTPLPRTKPIAAENLVLDHSLRLPGSIAEQQHTDGLSAEFLGHSPAHVDSGLAFGFSTSEPLLYPNAPNPFQVSRSEEILQESITDLPIPDDYPTSFLDNTDIPPTTIEAQANLPSQDSHTGSQPAEEPIPPFGTNSQFFAPYHTLPQPSQSAWPTGVLSTPLSVAPTQSSADDPIEILSSSPMREPDEERSPSPSNRSEPGTTSINQDDITRNNAQDVFFEDEEDEDADGSSEEEQYVDGGDRPGDDYDLRQYDRAHDDDDDIDESEEDPVLGKNVLEAQVIDPLGVAEMEEDEDEEDGESDGEAATYDEEAVEYEGRELERPENGVYEDDAEGEYYSDEEDYDEEDEEGMEDYESDADDGPPGPATSNEPVFISLLSDSDDDKEEEKIEPKLEKEPLPVEAPENPEEQEQADGSGEPEEAYDSEDSQEPEETDGLQEPEETDRLQEPEETEGLKVVQEEAVEEPPISVGKSCKPDLADITLETARNPGSAPSDEMDVDDKPEPSMLSNTFDNIGIIEPPRSEVTKELDALFHHALYQSAPSAGESKQTDDQQDQDPGTVEVGAVSPDQEANVTPVVEESNEKPKEADSIESPDRLLSATEQPTGSVDAMDVDEITEVHVEESEDATAAADREIADTTDDVKATGGAIIEGSLVTIIKVREGLDEVPRAAGSSITPGNYVQPLSTSNAAAQEIELKRDSADPTPDTEELGAVESPDVTMQDTSQVEVTAESRPPLEIDASETGYGEGVGEANSLGQLATAGQLVTDGQMSPPATQIAQTQPSQQNGDDTFSQATSILSHHEEHGHLATPGETQLEETEMEKYRPTEEHDDQTDEDDLGLENQIMAEFLQHSPAKHDNAQQHANPATSPKATPELTEAPRGSEPTGIAPIPDALITVKSLRSRGHRSTKSKSSDISQPDPSILLAKATTTITQPNEDVKASTSPTTLRITRSKADQADPSIQLARASMQTGGTKGKGRARDEDEADSSPTAKLRVSRSRATDRNDPSIQLAKGPSSSTRQSRRQVTPEPTRSTRSASRGVVQSGNTPDTAASVLKSPSVAGSFVAAEDENVGAVKLQLLKSLRTSLPEFLSLKVLRNSLHQATDILAVATTTPAQPHRPKHGPRDYMLTLNLIDPSAAPTGVSVAHIFRPHLSSLPVVHAGDVVLLRRVQVVSMKSRGFGVRAGDASAWAVFEKADEEMLPQIKGPPVEVTEPEIKYVEGLRRWWGLQDDKALEKIERASRKVSEAGKEDLK